VTEPVTDGAPGSSVTMAYLVSFCCPSGDPSSDLEKDIANST